MASMAVLPTGTSPCMRDNTSSRAGLDQRRHEPPADTALMPLVGNRYRELQLDAIAVDHIARLRRFPTLVIDRGQRDESQFAVISN